MPNVLHVISGIDAENGGPTRALLALAAAQARLGMDVRVVSTFRHPTGPANAPNFERAGVPVTLIGPAWGKPSWHPKIGSVLRPLIAGHDMVHIHSMFEEIQHRAARIAAALGKPYILCPHGGLDPWALAKSRLKKQLYLALRLRQNLNRASAIHYTTRAEQQSATPLGLRAPSVVVPNGIDLSEFDPLPAKGNFRQKHPEFSGRRIVLCLGRIDYKKGLDLLIPAFAQAAPPAAVLVLAGPDHGYGQEMRALAQRSGVADRVHFVGMLHDRERIEALVDADLFAMPSYVENFGISAIEALAAGTASLISDQVNVAESLGGVAGVEIVPATLDGVAAGLRRSLNAPPPGDQAVTALQTAAGVFGSDAVARLWLGQLERLRSRPLRKTPA